MYIQLKEISLSGNQNQNNHIMKATLNINGQLIEAMKFKTLKAANNFKSKLQGRDIIFCKASQYYVNI